MSSSVETSEGGPEDETVKGRRTTDEPSSGSFDESARGDRDRDPGGPAAVPRGRPGFREPPEEFVAAAKIAPDHWLSVVDRHWEREGEEPVPRWAILGRWRSDEHGEITEWQENTEYRPSPDAYGWSQPVSPADAAVQLVATGYSSEGLLALVLADAEVAVCLDEEGGFAVTEAADGTAAVPIFSPSPGLEQERLPRHEVMLIPDLLDRLPAGKELLFLSSSAPVGHLVTPTALRESKTFLDSVKAGERDDEVEIGTDGDWMGSIRAELREQGET